MAGHSKWANIQHRKKSQDAKRGKIFTKLIREITAATRLGGSDVNTNSRLRLVVDKALTQNMTRDTIDRAIKRGSGSDEGANLIEVRYEGYGPAGVAIIVDCMTDNRNRTVAEVRHAFSKHGGNLGSEGSVAYLFSKRGILTLAPGSDEDKVMEIALEAGAEDVVKNSDDSMDVLTTPENFEAVKEALTRAQLQPNHAEVTLLASTQVSLTNQENAAEMVELLEALEDLDDVQNVYSNADISDSILSAINKD